MSTILLKDANLSKGKNFASSRVSIEQLSQHNSEDAKKALIEVEDN